MKRIALLIAGLGVTLASGAAHAGPYTPSAYAFAESLVSNFTVGSTVAGTLLAGPGIDLSADAARFGTGGLSGYKSAGALATGVDIPQATSGFGPFPPANTTAKAAGYTLGMVGARADAALLAGSPFTGRGVSAGVVAEGALPTGAAGFAESAAIDWNWMLFGVTAPTSVSVAFKDDVALAAATTAATASASAKIATEVAIYDASGHKVFGFTPDGGGAGAILGATVTSDPFDLQSALGSYPGSAGLHTAGNDRSSDYFAALTDVLPVGVYKIGFSTYAFQRVVDAPEPATIGILAAGLIGLGAIRRRR